jgi:hypothetical protein
VNELDLGKERQTEFAPCHPTSRTELTKHFISQTKLNIQYFSHLYFFISPPLFAHSLHPFVHLYFTICKADELGTIFTEDDKKRFFFSHGSGWPYLTV